MRVVLADIARRAKVSLGTVSRVLNNDNIRVNKKTRQRIIEIAREAAYVPNRSAQALRTGKFHNISVVAYNITDAFAVECIETMEAALEQTDFAATWISCARKHENTDPMQFLNNIALTSDGLVVIAAEKFLKDTDLLQFWATRKLPMVSIIRRLPGDFMPSIRMDDNAGMRQLIDHLVRLGHRHIVFCVHKEMHPSASQRYYTFIDYMKERALPYDELSLVPAGITMEDGYQAGLQLIKYKILPTAVIAFNDLCAFGLIAAFGENGIRVPQDISVAGFDNIRVTRFYNPALTTVATDYEKVAQIAINELINSIEMPQERKETAADYLIPPALLERKSTAMART